MVPSRSWLCNRSNTCAPAGINAGLRRSTMRLDSIEVQVMSPKAVREDAKINVCV